MRSSDWSSDVCSSDLRRLAGGAGAGGRSAPVRPPSPGNRSSGEARTICLTRPCRRGVEGRPSQGFGRIVLQHRSCPRGQSALSACSMPFPNLPPVLAETLAARGYAEPTPVQAAVLELAAKGRDLILSAPTGSGKPVASGLAFPHKPAG